MVNFKSPQDKVFDVINVTLLGLILVVTAYPVYFVVIASISDPNLVSGGHIVFLPRGFNLEGYRYILKDDSILGGYRNSLFYAFGQTVMSIILTLPAAYALSRRDLLGRKWLMFAMVFTMYFTGGIIPFYVLIRKLGMINSVLALMLPNAVNVFNIIIARTFYVSSIPNELLESAQMDGCTNTRFFIAVVLPLSSAITAIIVLFNVVQNWNAFFHAMLFIQDAKKWPLQLILRRLLIMNEALTGSSDALTMMSAEEIQRGQQIADLLRYGIIVAAMAPLLILYPFLQKYFVKGIMIGSIKG
jgi:putative aldouronate transport system permease protein